MGIESLTIELSKSDGVYLPGEEVSGKVCISNLSSKILKGFIIDFLSVFKMTSDWDYNNFFFAFLSNDPNQGIYLECQGYSKFCFNELSSETYYSTEETYLDLKIPLISNEGT